MDEAVSFDRRRCYKNQETLSILNGAPGVSGRVKRCKHCVYLYRSPTAFLSCCPMSRCPNGFSVSKSVQTVSGRFPQKAPAVEILARNRASFNTDMPGMRDMRNLPGRLLLVHPVLQLTPRNRPRNKRQRTTRFPYGYLPPDTSKLIHR